MAYITWQDEENQDVLGYHIYWGESEFPPWAPPSEPIAKAPSSAREIHLPDITYGFVRVGVEVKGKIYLSADITEVTGDPITTQQA